MEVRCSNCATEYEFDDALVSARGTSVKCTNCGHQFRVHPAASGGPAAETWVVRDTAGKETTFTSLRDLQQGIVKGQLDPKHEMSHAGQSFRPLQEIYELQTFFNAARQRARPAPRTLLGVGRDGRPIRNSSPPPRRRASEPAQERVTPVAGVPAIKTPAASVRAGSSPSSSPPRVSLEEVARTGYSQRHSTPLPPYQSGLDRDTGAPTGVQAAVPWQHLQGLHSDSELDALAKGRGAGSRWIVAVVVLGALALIGGTVGREYFLGFIRREPVQARVDGRVPALLDQGRAALGRGDFDTASAELAKASVLAEADPRVAALNAQVLVSRAELSSLLLRANYELDKAFAEAKPPARKKTPAELATEAEVLAKQAADQKQLELTFRDHLAKAKAAVDEAVKRDPNALDVVRAHVDELRLEGQQREARRYVGALSAQATDAQNAFSLGALDQAEGTSGYPSAIDRLRVAARTEEGLGKARGLLVYVLAQSGDAPAARAELDKLETLAPQHRVLPALRSLVELAKAKAAPEESAEAAVRRPVAKPPASPEAVAGAAAPATGAATPGTSPASSGVSDLKSTLAEAGTLHRQGDLAGAERLYQSIIVKNPNNIPALSALGDIARQRQSNATAAVFYDRVLRIDRNHLPTLMSRGDMYWHSGNRLLAVALYRRALGRAGPSDPMGQRALSRIEEFDQQVQAESDPTTEAPKTTPTVAEDKAEPPAAAQPSNPAPEGAAPTPDSPAPGTGTTPTPKPSTPKEPPPKDTRPSPTSPPSEDSENKDAPAGESADRP